MGAVPKRAAVVRGRHVRSHGVGVRTYCTWRERAVRGACGGGAGERLPRGQVPRMQGHAAICTTTTGCPSPPPCAAAHGFQPPLPMQTALGEVAARHDAELRGSRRKLKKAHATMAQLSADVSHLQLRNRDLEAAAARDRAIVLLGSPGPGGRLGTAGPGAVSSPPPFGYGFGAAGADVAGPGAHGGGEPGDFGGAGLGKGGGAAGALGVVPPGVLSSLEAVRQRQAAYFNALTGAEAAKA